MTPREHDRLIAYTSHLPHILALSLVDVYEENSEKIVGRSFLDATRVADINEKLWVELFLAHKESLAHKIEDLTDFKRLIEEEKEALLTKKIERIKAMKERIKI